MKHHPKRPFPVSPAWILEACKTQQLPIECDFPPEAQPIPSVAKSSIEQQTEANNNNAYAGKPQLKRASSILSSVFKGHLFCCVRVAPPAKAVDFETKRIESLVRSHGGQLLSLKLLDALRQDHAKEQKLNQQQQALPSSNKPKRICHVVAWGGGFNDKNLQFHPTLSQIQRNKLCELVLVTPLWLQTCISVKKRVRPSKLPFVLAPQPFPLIRLQYSQKDKQALQICLTGFQGTEKGALVHMIHAIGADFHDNLSVNISHLIVAKTGDGNHSSSPKFEKALEWGLHIVSMEWLFHIARYGYQGKDSKTNDPESLVSGSGCEHLFSMVPQDEDDGGDPPSTPSKK